MLISLIAPCYNEGQVLSIFIEEICRVTSGIPNHEFEFIFINDGSRDDTLNQIKAFCKKDPRAKFISFSRNFGKEAGLLAGLKHAEGDYVAVMDCDMQDPPALLPEMIELLDTNDEYDCVATRRISRKGEPPIRSFFARSFYKMINKMSDTNIVDGARDYRLMRRNMVDAIISLPEYHRFSKGIFSWVGFETTWLEYENIERAKGETKWSFWKLLIYAVEGIVGFTTVPLRFATILGAFVSVFAFCYLIYIVVKTWFGHRLLAGYPSTMATILFIGGMIMLALGIIGEYIAKTYMESKHRPQYIVKETNVKKEDDTNDKQA